MLFDEILEGIKTVLEADADTKEVIQTYRKYHIVEQGVAKLPLCVIGPILDADMAAEYIGSLHRFEVPIAIRLLGRSYNTLARYQDLINIIDPLQENVCKAIVANPKLNDTVLDSHIAGITFIQPTEEYSGFSVNVSVKTNVE